MPATEHRVSLPPRYRVVRHIADGGMASVWAAEDELLGRLVAVKVLAPAYAQDDRAHKRFSREARAGARLSDHPHVVTVFDIGESPTPPTRPYMVMEYFPAGTVADRLRSGQPIPRPLAVRWLAEAASALDAAHAQDVVHRDVKPANLLLDDRGRLAVGDFGIATVASEASVTQTGQVLGTAAYISPEQALGHPATAASDRYALAAVGYELLTGQRPFTADSAAAQARAHVEATVPDASAVASLPREVGRLLDRGMAKDPGDRPATASAFVAELERALGAGAQPVDAPTEATRPLPTGAVPTPAVPPPPRTSAPGPVTPRVAAPPQPSRPTSTPASPPMPAGPPRVRGPASGRSRRRALPVLALLAAALLAGGVIAALGSGGGDEGSGAQGSGAARHGGASAGDGGSSSSGDSSSGSGSGASATKKAKPKKQQKKQQKPAAPAPAATPPSDTGSGDNPVALNDQGFERIKGGDFAGAVPVLERSVNAFRAQDRKDEMAYAFALFNLGQALNKSGRPAEAIPYLEERLRVSDFKRNVVRFELAAARSAAGQPSKGDSPD
jgi:eukaryotic-like serine/threonine-protein kinase